MGIPTCTLNDAGATGLIGSRLAARLSSQGHTVRVLTRNVNKARNKLQYASLQFYNTQQLQEAVRGADAVINLAGMHRMTNNRKHVLMTPAMF